MFIHLGRRLKVKGKRDRERDSAIGREGVGFGGFALAVRALKYRPIFVSWYVFQRGSGGTSSIKCEEAGFPLFPCSQSVKIFAVGRYEVHQVWHFKWLNIGLRPSALSSIFLFH